MSAAPSADRRPGRVLLTNDDGVDSTLLVPFIEALYDVAGGPANLTLRVLVPDAERSWSSKVMSRFNDVDMRATSREGHRVYTLTGTPADCAAVGSYHMDFHEAGASANGSDEGGGGGETRPDLVVSGGDPTAQAKLATLLYTIPSCTPRMFQLFAVARPMHAPSPQAIDPFFFPLEALQGQHAVASFHCFRERDTERTKG